jgi:AcrR family transcriptional regulator
MATQEDRSRATRANLCSAARDLFGERGFAGVAIGEIIDRAEVSRGALYHHFDGKAALLTAVVDELEERIAAHVQASLASVEDPLEGIEVALASLLDYCEDPIAMRLVFVEAPTALGWQYWRDMSTRHSTAILGDLVDRATAIGQIRSQPRVALIRMLYGAAAEMVLMIAASSCSADVREDCKAVLVDVVRSLAVRETAAP